MSTIGRKIMLHVHYMFGTFLCNIIIHVIFTSTHTLSYFFCQYLSLSLISSRQCASADSIPAVVALNVSASPLKSMLENSVVGDVALLPLIAALPAPIVNRG